MCFVDCHGIFSFWLYRCLRGFSVFRVRCRSAWHSSSAECLVHFPKKSVREKKVVEQSFQSSWFCLWTWLHYSESKDSVVCHLYSTPHAASNPFSSWNNSMMNHTNRVTSLCLSHSLVRPRSFHVLFKALGSEVFLGSTTMKGLTRLCPFSASFNTSISKTSFVSNF